MEIFFLAQTNGAVWKACNSSKKEIHANNSILKKGDYLLKELLTQVVPTQIKAACGLLDQTIEQLASSINSTPQAIMSAFSKTIDQDDTRLAEHIIGTLRKQGIEFIGDTGVNLYSNQQDVMVFRGETALAQLWADMECTIPNNGERFVFGVEEKKFQEYANERFYKFLENLKKRNIKTKILVDQGDYNFVDPTGEYRWSNSASEGEMPHFLYGDKYALLLWYPSPKIIVMHNKELSDSYRKVFNKVWDNASIPPKH